MSAVRRIMAAPPGAIDVEWGPFRPFFTQPASEPLPRGAVDVTDRLRGPARSVEIEDGASDSSASAGRSVSPEPIWGRSEGALPAERGPDLSSPAADAGAGAGAGDVTTAPRAAARGLPPLPPVGRFYPLFEAPPGSAGTGAPVTSRIVPVPVSHMGGSGKARATAVHAGAFWSPTSDLPVMSYNKELTNELEELQRHYGLKLGENDAYRAKNLEILLHWVRRCPYSIADQWEKAEAWFQEKDSKATGFGSGWRAKLQTWSTHGELEDLRDRRSNAFLMAADDFSSLWAVGPVKALKLARMGFKSVDVVTCERG